MPVISGIWRWNDDLSGMRSYGEIKFLFISNGRKFYGLLPRGFSHLVYLPTDEADEEGNTILTTEQRAPWVYDFNNNHWEDIAEPYKLIDLGMWSTNISDDFYTWFTTYATYVGESSWKIVYQASLTDGKWVEREAYQYQNSEWKKVNPAFHIYSIVLQESNAVSVDGIYGIGTDVIAEDGVSIYKVTIKSGVEDMLPEKVNVTNAEVLEWNRYSGILIIGNPSDDVTISV